MPPNEEAALAEALDKSPPVTLQPMTATDAITLAAGLQILAIKLKGLEEDDALWLLNFVADIELQLPPIARKTLADARRRLTQ